MRKGLLRLASGTVLLLIVLVAAGPGSSHRFPASPLPAYAKAATTGPCWLYDLPDNTLVLVPAFLPALATTRRPAAVATTPAPAEFKQFPPYIRPPPDTKADRFAG